MLRKIENKYIIITEYLSGECVKLTITNPVDWNNTMIIASLKKRASHRYWVMECNLTENS